MERMLKNNNNCSVANTKRKPVSPNTFQFARVPDAHTSKVAYVRPLNHSYFRPFIAKTKNETYTCIVDTGMFANAQDVISSCQEVEKR